MLSNFSLRSFFTILIIVGASATSLYGIWLILRTARELLSISPQTGGSSAYGITFNLIHQLILPAIAVVEALLVGVLTIYLRWIPGRLGTFLSLSLVMIALLLALAPLWMFIWMFVSQRKDSQDT